MRVTIRLFAIQRQQVGARQHVVELPAAATVADAWARVTADFPVLAASTDFVRFARNAVYADPTEPLADGDEVAVIPPVAGGAAVGRRIELSAEPLTDTLIAALRAEVSTDADGAVVVFVGQTRETAGTPAPGQEGEAARHARERVQELEYEAFDEMALTVLHAIADEIEARFGVERLAIIHRTGTVAVGDASVVICVAAPHRGAAFDAARYAIDELKARAPIWKSEHFEGGSVWLGAPARTSAAMPTEPLPEGTS